MSETETIPHALTPTAPAFTARDRRAREILEHLASNVSGLVVYLDGEAARTLPVLDAKGLSDLLVERMVFDAALGERIATAVADYRNTYLRRRSPCLILLAASDDDGLADIVAETLNNALFGAGSVFKISASGFPSHIDDRESMLDQMLSHAGVIRVEDIDRLAAIDGDAREFVSRSLNLKQASTYGNQIVVATVSTITEAAVAAWNGAGEDLAAAEYALRGVMQPLFAESVVGRANLVALGQKPEFDEALLAMASVVRSRVRAYGGEIVSTDRQTAETLRVFLGDDKYMEPKEIRRRVCGEQLRRVCDDMSELRRANVSRVKLDAVPQDETYSDGTPKMALHLEHCE